MSFAFAVEADSYDQKTRTRTITRFKKLYDVAAVDMPAYDQTSISARAYFDAEKEKESRIEQIRQRLLLRARL